MKVIKRTGVNLLDEMTLDIDAYNDERSIGELDSKLHMFYQALDDTERKDILTRQHEKLMNKAKENSPDYKCPDSCFGSISVMAKGNHGSGNFRFDTSKYDEVTDPLARVHRIKHSIVGKLIRGQERIPVLIEPSNFVTGFFSRSISKENNKGKGSVLLVTGKGMLVDGSEELLKNSPVEFETGCCNPFLASKNIGKELKYFGKSIAEMTSLMTDPHFVKDVSDEMLVTLRKLYHLVSEPHVDDPIQMTLCAQVEISLLKEFRDRNIEVPSIEDKLTEIIKSSADCIARNVVEKLTAETPP